MFLLQIRIKQVDWKQLLLSHIFVLANYVCKLINLNFKKLLFLIKLNYLHFHPLHQTIILLELLSHDS